MRAIMPRMRSRRAALALIGSLTLLVAATPEASACIGLSAEGVVPVRGEEALIAWDEASRTEHFVRSARFDRMARDFGFIVPTPSEPTLTEVSERVFHRLFDLYRRPVRRAAPGARTRSADALGGLGDAGGVEVVSETQVAGLTGTVLRATSPTALDAWLTEHGYATTPALGAWLAPYVAGGWYLTAFRVDPAGAAGPVAMRAVRMSFHAERAFFPYSEPQTEGGRPRPFRVSVVAGTRVTARVGDEPWSAHVGFARRTSRLHAILRDVVPDEALAETPWITTFDEPRSLRGTSDLFFEASSETRGVASRLDRQILAFRGAR